jgi:hypothetical protein
MNRLSTACFATLPLPALVVPAGCATKVTAPSRRATRPNSLFAFADDHTARLVGADGSRINRTLNETGRPDIDLEVL